MAAHERDDADVLEVTDLAHAIARAEEVIRARSSSSLGALVGPDSSGSFDLFDALVATDDTSGPAVHAPCVPTPIPPPHAAPAPRLPPPTLLPCVPDAPRVLETSGAPILIVDEEAFRTPAGRLPRFAAERGARSEASRARRRLSWIVAAVLAPVALVVFVVGLGRAEPGADPSSAPVAVASPVPAAERPAEPSAAERAAPRARLEPNVEPSEAVPSIPVLHVNSLKNAPPAGKRSR